MRITWSSARRGTHGTCRELAGLVRSPYKRVSVLLRNLTSSVHSAEPELDPSHTACVIVMKTHKANRFSKTESESAIDEQSDSSTMDLGRSLWSGFRKRFIRNARSSETSSATVSSTHSCNLTSKSRTSNFKLACGICNGGKLFFGGALFTKQIQLIKK